MSERESVAVALHRRGESGKVAWVAEDDHVREWYREWADEILTLVAR